MSRDKQIEGMAKCCPYYDDGKCHPTDNETVDCDLMCNMFGFMANLEKAGYRKQSEWISVDERLPERDGKYIVYTTRGTIELARCYSYVNGTPQFDYWITHWMPLPEPPKKGGE